MDQAVNMGAETLAKHVVEEACGSGFEGLSVIYTFSPIDRRIPNRKRRAQEKERLRLLAVAGQIAKQLQENRQPQSAKATAESEGFGDCIVIAESPEQLLVAVSERFRSGDNVWDAYEPVGDVVRIGFWHDKTHPRVF